MYNACVYNPVVLYLLNHTCMTIISEDYGILLSSEDPTLEDRYHIIQQHFSLCSCIFSVCHFIYFHSYFFIPMTFAIYVRTHQVMVYDRGHVCVYVRLPHIDISPRTYSALTKRCRYVISLRGQCVNRTRYVIEGGCFELTLPSLRGQCVNRTRYVIEGGCFDLTLPSLRGQCVNRTRYVIDGGCFDFTLPSLRGQCVNRTRYVIEGGCFDFTLPSLRGQCVNRTLYVIEGGCFDFKLPSLRGQCINRTR